MLAFPYGVVLNDQASVNTKHKAPDDISRRFHTHGYFGGQVTGSQFEQIITGIYSLLSLMTLQCTVGQMIGSKGFK